MYSYILPRLLLAILAVFAFMLMHDITTSIDDVQQAASSMLDEATRTGHVSPAAEARFITAQKIINIKARAYGAVLDAGR